MLPESCLLNKMCSVNTAGGKRMLLSAVRGGGITVERWPPSYFIREVHLQELNTCVLISLLFRRRGYGRGGGEREGRGGEERMGGVVVAHNIDQACFSSSLQNRYGHKLLTGEYKGASPAPFFPLFW